MESKEWHHRFSDQKFMVSANPEHLSYEFIQASFADPAMYWARPVSPEDLRIIVEKSCFLGLYLENPNPTAQSEPSSGKTEASTTPQSQTPVAFTQIGMARLVTDYVTISFLTDVYVVPEYQGKGLGKWMVQCVKDLTDTMPDLRRLMFMAKNAPHAIKFYEDLLGARVYDQEKSKVVFMSSWMPGLDA